MTYTNIAKKSTSVMPIIRSSNVGSSPIKIYPCHLFCNLLTPVGQF